MCKSNVDMTPLVWARNYFNNFGSMDGGQWEKWEKANFYKSDSEVPTYMLLHKVVRIFVSIARLVGEIVICKKHFYNLYIVM